MKNELKPIYDSRKSFYGKAVVETSGGWGQNVNLYSYGTNVASIGYLDEFGTTPVMVLYPEWDYSATTLRHVKEFMRQNGFSAMTKNEIIKDATPYYDCLVLPI